MEEASQPIEDKVETQRQLARNLRGFEGNWVAVKGSEVMVAAPTLRNVVEQAEGQEYDRTFYLPKRGRRLILGRIALR